MPLFKYEAKDLQHSVLFSEIVPDEKIRKDLLAKFNKRFNTEYAVKAKKKTNSFVTMQTLISMLRILNQEKLLANTAYTNIRVKTNNGYPFSKIVFD